MQTPNTDSSRREALVQVLSDALVDLLLRDQRRPSSERIATERADREAPP